jgi:hypothetical protein
MCDQTGTNDRPVKVELHLHLSLEGEPPPGWRAWDGVRYGPAVFESVSPKRSRWVGRTVGAIALVALTVGATAIAHRMIAASESGALLAAARLPPVVSPPAGPARADSVPAESQGGDAHVVGSAGSRSGTAAFGLN